MRFLTFNNAEVSMYKASIRQVGNSAGLLLPKALLENLHLKAGDELFIIPTETGFTVKIYDEDYILQMQEGEKIAHQYKNVLRALAKEDPEGDE